jgi:hypothetical protein
MGVPQVRSGAYNHRMGVPEVASGFYMYIIKGGPTSGPGSVKSFYMYIIKGGPTSGPGSVNGTGLSHIGSPIQCSR